MLQSLVYTAGRFLRDLNRSLLGHRFADAEAPKAMPRWAPQYKDFARVVLTDEVARTLFEGYAAHRAGVRGEEETGWLLLGLRKPAEAVVLATLPAGANSSAGVAHVRFNSNAQALASRIVRQADRRLTILGVVHTHPGSLRHPSDGDYRGDSCWVGQLRGGEGIFGIGTVNGQVGIDGLVAWQPRPHVQCWGDMRLSWYALRKGDRTYRRLSYSITLGPDLARPLHPVWPTIEAHAEPLDRLCRQQVRVTLEPVPGNHGPALSVDVALAQPGDAIRVIMEGTEVRYYVKLEGKLLAVDSDESRVDRGIYLLLAELTTRRF